MRMQVVCRGSVTEGLGHILRTRTFANHAARFHEVEVLALVDPDLEILLASLPCPVYPARREIDLLPRIARFQPEVLVFDTTRMDPDTLAAARRPARLLVSISPVFDQAARLDFLVTRARPPRLPGVQILAGLEYAIFGDHCQPIEEATYERNLSLPELPIAVSMGGADAANKTLAVLQAITRMPEPSTIIVLLGEGYAHSYNALVDKVRGDTRHEVILAKTNRSMWRVMSHAAVGLLAGGLTTVEAIHAGLPTLNLLDRPEHRHLLGDFFDLGVCLDGGPFSRESLDRAVQTLRHLHGHRDELRRMRQRSAGLLDNHGPRRVLQAIEQELASRSQSSPSPVHRLEACHVA